MAAPRSLTLGVLLAALLAVAATAVREGGVPPRRGLQARPLVGGTAGCMNTKAGRWLSADDQGMVCRLEEVDSATGCCVRGQKYSCETCLSEDNCCAEYEYCVSCCMAAEHTPEDAHIHTYRSPGRSETGQWGSVFELCRGKCRTSSKSTVHENAYLGARHHCYGDRPRPLLEPQQPVSTAITILAADQPNLSCHQVCSRAGKSCSTEHFPEVNRCDRLRDHFQCEAGCEKNTVGNRRVLDVRRVMVALHRPLNPHP